MELRSNLLEWLRSRTYIKSDTEPLEITATLMDNSTVSYTVVYVKEEDEDGG